jgi:hypothetical protein
MLRCLRDGAAVLHKQIPYQFQPYIVEIICFSFTGSQAGFEKFLEVIKQGCFRLYEMLRASSFENLLRELSSATRSM